MPRVAIASTVRNPGPSITSFVRHHLASGVDSILLFFDDPDDPWIDAVPDDDRVSCIACDAELRSSWADWPERALVDEQVMARQILNVELALQVARNAQIEWLVHLDADELLDCAERSIPEYLAGRDGAIDQVTFLNLEVIPETDDVLDMFREMTLFKRNPRTLPDPAQQRELLARVPQLRDRWFFYYTIGKSAVRVRPGARPDGVHRFRHVNGALRTEIVDAPRILHYMNAGFENFWRRYQTWGRFPDHWFGGELIRDRIGAFHLEARDAVATGDRELARRFYRERVVVSDPDAIAALLASSLCERVDGPARRLAQIAGEHLRR